jgi:hypothetical protein
MKLMSIIGMTLAAALCLAIPASAAVAIYDPIAPLVAPAQVNDCVTSLAVENAILFVEANQGCDLTMAELTGLCLAPVAVQAVPARIAAVLAPDLDISCTATRPSPPG